MNREDSITLTPREQQRLQVLHHVITGQLSAEGAATALAVTPRQVWRMKAAYLEHGLSALAHGNRGRTSPHRLSEDVRQQVLTAIQGRYAGCNDSHLRDLLALHDGIVLNRRTIARLRHAAGVGATQKRRAPRHRSRRDRMAQRGMLLQVDGSLHHWLGAEQPRCSLLAAVDDATSEVVSAVFREQEDAHGYFLVLQEVLRTQGIPLSLYHDRHGIFQRNTTAPWTLEEQLAGRLEPTQFGRALEELGIGSIAAHSPQAKGRVERLWGTLQGRLVTELRMEGVHDLKAANRFLPGFLERYNSRFAISAEDPEPAYRGIPLDLDLQRVLSFRYPRVVANDNTVSLEGLVLQIPPGPRRRSYARARVWVHELLDGSLGVWHQDRWILRTPRPALARPVRARRRQPARGSAGKEPPRQLRLPAATQPPVPARPAVPPKPAPDHPWRRQPIGRPRPEGSH